jgi:UDP:flavonoid glycosyltransferase YjiC (YdhE family)
MIALGCALAARGHDVTLQTWERWREHVEAEGLTFAPAPEYTVFPSSGTEPLDFYEAVVYATRDTLPLVESLAPDVVVADILTLAPALAAELQDIPCATLIPHVYPQGEPGMPIYSLGARLPRTALGHAFWRAAAHRLLDNGLQLGRTQLNRTREQVGLQPVTHVHGGTSRELALVATFPQLEYPRAWPDGVHIVGPLMWEPPAADVELPPGDAPLVLVAPSTGSGTPDARCRTAGAGRRARAGTRHVEPPLATSLFAGAQQRAASGVGLLLTHDAPLRRGRLPRRSRHARARAVERLRRRSLSRGRRHERERGAP